MSREAFREWAIACAIAAVLVLLLYVAMYWGSRPLPPEPAPAPIARTNTTVLTEMCATLPRTADEASRSVLAEWIIKSSDQLPATLSPPLKTCLAQARSLLRS